MAHCFANRKWSASLDTFAERFAVDVAHDEAENLVPLFDSMDRNDVRMREGRSGAGFLKEPRAQVGTGREIRGEKLDCDRTVELNVVREIDGAHSSASKLFFQDVVGSKRVPHFLFGNHGRDGCGHRDSPGGVVKTSQNLRWIVILAVDIHREEESIASVP